MVDNKRFWKIGKRFFRDTSNCFENIILVEKDVIVSGDQQMDNIFYKSFIFDKYFNPVEPNLKPKVPENLLSEISNTGDSILKQ